MAGKQKPPSVPPTFPWVPVPVHTELQGRASKPLTLQSGPPRAELRDSSGPVSADGRAPSHTESLGTRHRLFILPPETDWEDKNIHLCPAKPVPSLPVCAPGLGGEPWPTPGNTESMEGTVREGGGG